MVISRDFVVSMFLISATLGIAISYSKIYLFHISLLFLALYFLLILLNNNLTITKTKTFTKLHYFFFVMLAWYSLALFWSIDTQSTFVYLFYILCGVSIALTIVYYTSNQEKLDKVFKIVAAVFLIEIIFSLLEVFTSFRLPISPYSNYLSFFGKTDIDLGNVHLLVGDVPTGFRWNPNNLATTMTLIFPFILLHPKRLVKYIGSIAIIVLVISSESRGNILAMSAIFILFTYLTNRRRALIFGSFFAVAGILFLFFVAPLMEQSDNYKIRRAHSSFASAQEYLLIDANSRNDSIGVRKTLIDQGIEGLKNSYGLGVGGGASTSLGSVRGIESMHNFWIEILVEGGVLFFIAFLIWYLTLLNNLRRAAKSSDKRISYFATASLISLVGFVFGAISTSSVIYFFPMWILFGFAIATINHYKRSKYIRG